MLRNKGVILLTTTKKRIKQLRCYKDKHGNLNVPHDSEEKRVLYSWCNNQRWNKKRGKLNPEIEAALNEIGFQWENQLSKGFPTEERIEELRDFKKEHGHFNVPSKSKEYSVLYSWRNNQRWKKRKGNIIREIEEALDEMGFVWEPSSLRFRTEERIKELRAFKEQHGHFNVPQSSNPGLYHWIDLKRRKRRKGNVLPEVEVALDEMGFDWKTEKIVHSRLERLEQLRSFKKKYGHFNVPFDSEEYLGLNKWFVNQRHTKRQGKILREIEAALDEMGFEWEGKCVGTSAPELRIFTELQLIFDRVIHRHKVEGREIDIYLPEINLAIEYDGSYFHREKEDRDRKKNCFLKSKNIPLMRVRHFPLKKLSEQDLVVKKDTLTKSDLNSIVSTIRTFAPKNMKAKLDAYENSETFLNDELFKKSLCPSFTLYNHERIKQLRDFKEKHGHCKVTWASEEYSVLYSWCAKQRSAKRRGNILREIEKSLDKLGFEWDIEPRAKKRIEELRAFKEKHGNLNVPHASEEYFGLYIWIRNQKSLRKQGKLSDYLIKLLDELDFGWETSRASTEDRIEELRDYKEKYGDCNVPSRSKEYPGLYDWCNLQKHAKRKGKINPETETTLDEIGFVWERTTLQAATLKRIEELRAYKEQHGNFNVTRASKEYPGLGSWCYDQRFKKRKGKIQPEVEAALDEMGFVWER